MKITAISDTHGKHRRITLSDGDVLIHAGDFTHFGSKDEVVDFIDWFVGQNYTHKVFIAGNHELSFESDDLYHMFTYRQRTFNFDKADWLKLLLSSLPSNVHYLENSGVTIDGIRLWGSPITPEYGGWAFNKQRGSDIRKVWEGIPESDIVITHGPVGRILDEVDYVNVGCIDLRDRLSILKPKVHICGHIHDGYGSKNVDGVEYINASIQNDIRRTLNEPVDFLYTPDGVTFI